MRPNSTHTTRSKHCTTVWGERNTLLLRATRGPSIHILRFVDECIANRVPRYLSNYFNVRNRDIHRHKTRNNNDLILEKINLECTKRAFFYKGAKIFNNF